MIRDPEIRDQKYGPLRTLLLAMGYTARVLLRRSEPDGLAVWVSGPEQNEDRGWAFMILGRTRGWFVKFPRGELFQIGDPANVTDIALKIARSFCENSGGDAAVLLGNEISVSDRARWLRDERAEELAGWHAAGWEVLSESDVTNAFAAIEKGFNSGRKFRPRIRTFSWRVKDLLHQQQPASREERLTLAILDAFCQLIEPEGHLLALTWQSTCYRFFPHRGSRRIYRDYWAQAIWPDGDSTWFMSPGAEFGLLSEWNGGFHIFGEKLLAVAADPVSEILGPPKESGPIRL